MEDRKIQFLNDSKKFIHILRLSKTILKERYKNKKKKFEDSFMEAYIFSNLDVIENNVFDVSEIEELNVESYPEYTALFSKYKNVYLRLKNDSEHQRISKKKDKSHVKVNDARITNHNELMEFLSDQCVPKMSDEMLAWFSEIGKDLSTPKKVQESSCTQTVVGDVVDLESINRTVGTSDYGESSNSIEAKPAFENEVIQNESEPKKANSLDQKAPESLSGLEFVDNFLRRDILRTEIKGLSKEVLDNFKISRDGRIYCLACFHFLAPEHIKKHVIKPGHISKRRPHTWLNELRVLVDTLVQEEKPVSASDVELLARECSLSARKKRRPLHCKLCETSVRWGLSEAVQHIMSPSHKENTLMIQNSPILSTLCDNYLSTLCDNVSTLCDNLSAMPSREYVAPPPKPQSSENPKKEDIDLVKCSKWMVKNCKIFPWRMEMYCKVCRAYVSLSSARKHVSKHTKQSKNNTLCEKVSSKMAQKYEKMASEEGVSKEDLESIVSDKYMARGFYCKACEHIIKPKKLANLISHIRSIRHERRKTTVEDAASILTEDIALQILEKGVIAGVPIVTTKKKGKRDDGVLDSTQVQTITGKKKGKSEDAVLDATRMPTFEDINNLGTHIGYNVYNIELFLCGKFKYLCKLCGVKIATDSELFSHMNNNHPKNVPSILAGFCAENYDDILNNIQDTKDIQADSSGTNHKSGKGSDSTNDMQDTKNIQANNSGTNHNSGKGGDSGSDVQDTKEIQADSSGTNHNSGKGCDNGSDVQDTKDIQADTSGTNHSSGKGGDSGSDVQDTRDIQANGSGTNHSNNGGSSIQDTRDAQADSSGTNYRNRDEDGNNSGNNIQEIEEGDESGTNHSNSDEGGNNSDKSISPQQSCVEPPKPNTTEKSLLKEKTDNAYVVIDNNISKEELSKFKITQNRRLFCTVCCVYLVPSYISSHIKNKNHNSPNKVIEKRMKMLPDIVAQNVGSEYVCEHVLRLERCILFQSDSFYCSLCELGFKSICIRMVSDHINSEKHITNRLSIDRSPSVSDQITDQEDSEP